MEERKTPLLTEIAEYLRRTAAGFHTPGHRQGRGSYRDFRQLVGDKALAMDLTEVPGLDNLREPDGCLRESQDLAARLFGSAATFYLVNGSTVGLQAALLALNSPGGKVLIPRHAHVSILNGLILSGGEPAILPVELEKTWGIPLGVSPAVLSGALSGLLSATQVQKRGMTAEAVKTPCLKGAGEQGIEPRESPGHITKAVDVSLTVQPTYQGIGYNAAKIRQLHEDKGIIQIVDEAHGAHLFFQEEPPLSMQKEKADLVIQSTHKTLSSLTQASMLHVNNPHLVAAVCAALNILQTTSPSYLLMASLESARAQMAEKGRKLMERVLELADFFRRKIAEIPGYAVFSKEDLAPGWEQDPSKVLVSAAPLGLTGWELAEILRGEYGLVAEMADYYYVLFLITIGHCREDIEMVIKALREIGKNKAGNALGGPGLCGLGNAQIFYEKPVRLVMTPRMVYYNKQEELDLAQAVGRVSGASLTVYPPGIPCLWPGQLIEREHVEYLQWARQNNLKIQGLRGGQNIVVCR